MTNPTDIVSAVVNKLKAIPGLVALLTSSSQITGHSQSFPAKTFQEAIYEISPPAVLVAWRGLTSTRMGLSHTILIAMRPGSGVTAGQMIAAILDGVPTGAPTKFLFDEPHSALSHPENVRAEIASLMIGDNPPAYIDFPQITLDLIEKRS